MSENIDEKKHYKFECGLNKTSRKQWFYSESDDYFVYRRHLFQFAQEMCEYFISNPEKRVLEIGPSSAVFPEKAHPEISTEIIAQTCKTHGVYYKTLDLVKESGCDYICSADDMSCVTEKFDIIILIGIIEHIPKVWQVPKQLYNSLNEGGLLYVHTPYMFKVHGPIPDCWRFSQYGYEALFGDLFTINKVDTYPSNEVGKNSFPLSINVTLQRK
jgi:2-polyprenyl-3-methyl-5-hydroxy-6-metoxy-1,4-benzoquinol methylase